MLICDHYEKVGWKEGVRKRKGRFDNSILKAFWKGGKTCGSKGRRVGKSGKTFRGKLEDSNNDIVN